MLPLHVFEPRYRAMIRDALDTHRAIAVVLVTDPHPTDEHGPPAIARTAGAASIVEHGAPPGGRCNLLARGRARVRLEELPFGERCPYRRPAASIIEPLAIDVPAGDL